MSWTLTGSSDEVGKWVSTHLGGVWLPGSGHALGLVSGSRLIAGVAYDNFNNASIGMSVYAVPGCRWLTRSFLQDVFAYPFLQLGVRKILGQVSESNLVARRFDEHLGFVHEATLKDAHPDGDLLIYTMTKDQCRWLNLKVPNGQEISSPSTRLHRPG